MAKVICEICGKEIEENDVVTTSNGDTICNDCFEENYFVCDCCGEIVHKDNAEYVYNSNGDVVEVVCDDCSCSDTYYRCDDCGRLFTADDVNSYNDGDGCVCNYCLSRNCDDYYTCDNCGGLYTTDCGRWDNDGDYWYCDSCAEDCIDSGIISDYHCHPNDIEFFGDTHNDTNPFLGVELEIDNGNINNDECAEHTQSCLADNFIYFEYDGSLNEGFENITQPATLEYHTNIKDNYKKAFDFMVHNGYRSHNTSTCGLHVHFNRTFFGNKEELCTARLLYLVEKFWDKLVIFSRRDIDHLDRWAKKYTKRPTEVIKEWKEHRYTLSRYQAVNLTNDNTIEFRMFRGTLNLNTFIATLQLCDTLVKIAKYSTAESIQRMKWEDLLQYDEIKQYWQERMDRQERIAERRRQAELERAEQQNEIEF